MKNLSTLILIVVTLLFGSMNILAQQSPTPSTGCVSGNCVNGYGKFITSAGDTYEGNFVNNTPNGKGKFTYADGSVYEGGWVNGKFEGQGTYIFKNGEVYTGQHANGKQNGRGKFRYASGDVYEGEFVNNKREGQGIFTYKNGDVYIGHYGADLRNGKGKNSFANGDVYDGDFVNGKREGQGTYTFKNGNYHTGEFKNDKKNGYGKEYIKSTNSMREGTWKDDVFVTPLSSATSPPSASTGCVSGNCVDGRGKMVYDNGNSYEGGWVNSKKEGHGTFTFKNGSVYTGQYVNDKKHGKGKLSFANGDTYDGDFADDEREGQGTYTYKDGSYHTGGYEDDKRNGYAKEYTKSTNITRQGIWKDGVFGHPLWAYKKEQGNKQFAAKKYAEAVKSYTECIKDNAKADECYNGRGKAYWTLDKEVEASADLEKAVKLNPNNKQAVADLNKMKENKDELFNLSIFVEDPYDFLNSIDFEAYDKLSGEQNTDAKAAKTDAPKQTKTVKTEKEWKEICEPYWRKMYDALEKKDIDSAKKIYAEFNAETKDANNSIVVKVRLNLLLNQMYLSKILQLEDFVESEMKRLKYTDKEKEEVKRDNSKGYYV